MPNSWRTLPADVVASDTLEACAEGFRDSESGRSLALGSLIPGEAVRV